MARDDDTTLDDLLGELRDQQKTLERMEKLLKMSTEALINIFSVASDVKTLLEAKTGIDIKKLYKKAPKPQEEPEYCMPPSN